MSGRREANCQHIAARSGDQTATGPVRKRAGGGNRVIRRGHLYVGRDNEHIAELAGYLGLCGNPRTVNAVIVADENARGSTPHL